jgi:hypothetical protein
MRMMLKMHIPVESGNAAIKDGRLGKVLADTLERLQPEAAYFTTVGANRGGYIVFDLKDPSDIPPACEPLFHELGADIELTPVMTPEEVRAGVAKAFPG